MAFEEDVYELDSIWSNEWFSEHDTLRLKRIVTEVMSLNVNSLIDVGCGNGMFLNYLIANHKDRFIRLCGAERSKAAFQHIKTEKVLCGIDSLPFSDNEFDLVTCQEVIEHLPISIYEKSLQELSRVSNKYILISVPYNENLKKSLVSCPYCKTEFNPEYHMRSFHENDFARIEHITGTKMIKNSFIEIETYAFLGFIKWVYRNKNTFPAYTICPLCGYNENNKMVGSHSIKKANKAKRVLKEYWPRRIRKRWVYAIFEKTI